jgi:hypothetical protein
MIEYLPDDNDGRFPEDTPVLVMYPLRDDQNDRDSWPWLPGTVLAQSGPDEWRVVVEVPALAVPDPSVPNRHAPDNLLYPACSATRPRFAPSTCTTGSVCGTRLSTTDLS